MSKEWPQLAYNISPVKYGSVAVIYRRIFDKKFGISVYKKAGIEQFSDSTDYDDLHEFAWHFGAKQINSLGINLPAPSVEELLPSKIDHALSMMRENPFFWIHAYPYDYLAFLYPDNKRVKIVLSIGNFSKGKNRSELAIKYLFEEYLDIPTKARATKIPDTDIPISPQNPVVSVTVA